MTELRPLTDEEMEAELAQRAALKPNVRLEILEREMLQNRRHLVKIIQILETITVTGDKIADILKWRGR